MIYREELEQIAADDDTVEVKFTITREPPRVGRDITGASTARCWRKSRGRLLRSRGLFVCGPTPLVESVAGSLVDLGHEPALVKTERFGPTGGST